MKKRWFSARFLKAQKGKGRKRLVKLRINQESKRERVMGKGIGVNMTLFRSGFVILMTGMCLMVPLALASPSPLTITIGTFFPYYSPQSVEIGVGTSITWENPTADLHTITHDACRTYGPCAFDSGAIGPRRTFTLDQLPPGHYPYHCTFHPIMRGVLVVHESDVPEET